MHVLGAVNSPVLDDPYLINATTKSNSNVPRISCSRARGIQVIMFNRPLPNRMQYISLTPMSLALEDKLDLGTRPSHTMEAEDEHAEARNRDRMNELVEKLKYHT